ncbi:flagellar hook-associated protein 1 FlgK [Ruminiclostridium sufflavum DSM 19573]|uniref:Flagellar hook-associated protein 1 n=1 Tax=Ruminiclostridium sufflavum DSM 19573 TaxID=1121337 RepID=A0A318XMM3_9FIRM|nr:flagellar hook-associated protein FlgK [Ruminiclostridium sufflavum]PYG89112.1 flagellar hook-associated protein 1 FlgK [Ruminiclostridium sufflavum DSM 19573]
MRQSFFGLNIAVSGIYTAQKNLITVGHNISNASTTGYSRQQNVQSASKPLNTYDGTGMIGTGSEITGVKRIRDTYLDFKYWSENIANGEWSKKAELLSEIETTFNEPSGSGFTKIMDSFYSSLQELSKDPSSQAVRALVRENGVTLANYFNTLAARFEGLQEDINDQVKINVEKINSLGDQIAKLNKQIYAFELTGESANDLRDSRTVLVDELSKLVNINATEVKYGKLPNGEDDIHFVITIGGNNLVDHYSSRKLVLNQRDNELNSEDVPNLYDVEWDNGNKLILTGGVLKGLIDVRDGKDGAAGADEETETPSYKGVPYYQSMLNEFVRTFAMAFNEGYKTENGVMVDGTGHVDGYGVDTDGTGPATATSGLRFFTMFGEGDTAVSSDEFIDGATGMSAVMAQYQKITAKNFTVGLDVMSNPNAIATTDAAGENGNINVLNELMKIRSDANLFTEGAPEDFMKSLIATLGIDSQQASTFSDSQKTIVKQIDNRRMSVSGVQLNEELANMIKYQQSFKASAKMINTMDEVYDTLINRLGVG